MRIKAIEEGEGNCAEKAALTVAIKLLSLVCVQASYSNFLFLRNKNPFGGNRIETEMSQHH
jgi:hypothetical protein